MPIGVPVAPGAHAVGVQLVPLATEPAAHMANTYPRKAGGGHGALLPGITQLGGVVEGGQVHVKEASPGMPSTHVPPLRQPCPPGPFAGLLQSLALAGVYGRASGTWGPLCCITQRMIRSAPVVVRRPLQPVSSAQPRETAVWR